MTKRAKSYLPALIILICASCSSGSSNNASTIAAPRNLNAVTVSSIQIDLAWDASPDIGKVAGYNIYRNGTKIISYSTTTYSDRSLSQSTNYCYTVTAYDTSGNESLQSNKACAETGIAPGWELTVNGKTISGTNSKAVLETSDNAFLVLGTASLYTGGTTSIYLVKINNSGSILWEKTYSGSDVKEGTSLIKTIDGNYLILGSIIPTSQTNKNIYIAKVDTSGSLLWEKTFNSVDYIVGNDIIQNLDGTFIIAGIRIIASTTPNTDIYIVKIDSNGNVIWTQTFGSSKQEYGNSLQATASGGYMITGSNDGNLYILNVDAEGIKLWDQVIYGGTNGHSIIPTDDGNYVIVGDTWGDVYLTKIDASGTLLWDHSYGANYQDIGYSVQQTTDGGYILTGWKGYHFEYNYYGDFEFPPDLYLIKTTANGSVVWEKTYGNGYVGYSVSQTSDGGYIVVGTAKNNAALYVIKTDESGNVY